MQLQAIFYLLLQEISLNAAATKTFLESTSAYRNCYCKQLVKVGKNVAESKT
jgi:hypothetical protein